MSINRDDYQIAPIQHPAEMRISRFAVRTSGTNSDGSYRLITCSTHKTRVAAERWLDRHIEREQYALDHCCDAAKAAEARE